ARNERPQLGEMAEAVRRGVQHALWREYAADLGERARPVLDVVEHVVRQDDVERAVWEGKRLGFGDVVVGSIAELVPCRLDHSGGDVGERELPTRIDAIAVCAPEQRGPAAEVEDPRRAAERGFLREQPLLPVRADRETLMERDPRFEVVRGGVLLSQLGCNRA